MQAEAPPSFTAAQRVFDFGELVEMILLQLRRLLSDFQDINTQADILRSLLLSQHINTTFHGTVQRSTKIQQLLHIQSPECGTARTFYIHPLLWPTASRRSPIGIENFRLHQNKLLLTVNDATLVFMLQNFGSWRKLRVAWDKEDFSRCEVTSLRGIRSTKIYLKLDGIETAGELADAIVKAVMERRIALSRR